ncbi:hypothetical protein A8990_12635 [Paenibacillus taihuensis]|uniref:Uncharacterized protein n=1 Tax=Paenibacillus taihuensis TaxID=1156355 RepID=A0A3D9RR36_9BACL|nr:hypothetical protein [Paenibacillus taihuensis]REE78561.1 hypothetical protein A8990_12635 [Paenibacillus taihuensis]
MNKLVIVLFMVLVLVGCSDKSISLIGEGVSWKGEYTANITEGDRENGKYTFSYKYETDNGLKNLEKPLMEKWYVKRVTTKKELLKFSVVAQVAL